MTRRDEAVKAMKQFNLIDSREGEQIQCFRVSESEAGRQSGEDRDQ